MRKVEQVDYMKLVADMAAAGMGMEEVLNAQTRELGKPETKNEALYFWRALFNASRQNDAVWLFLMNLPQVRHIAPPEAQLHTSGIFVSELPLPVIGGEDDEPFVKAEGPKRWPAEPTEQNFIEQAAVLDSYLEEAGKECPENRCKSVAEYVETWWYSGTGRMEAAMQLFEGGYLALASDAGLEWLRATYPPAEAMAHA